MKNKNVYYLTITILLTILMSLLTTYCKIPLNIGLMKLDPGYIILAIAIVILPIYYSLFVGLISIVIAGILSPAYGILYYTIIENIIIVGISHFVSKDDKLKLGINLILGCFISTVIVDSVFECISIKLFISSFIIKNIGTFICNSICLCIGVFIIYIITTLKEGNNKKKVITSILTTFIIGIGCFGFYYVQPKNIFDEMYKEVKKTYLAINIYDALEDKKEVEVYNTSVFGNENGLDANVKYNEDALPEKYVSLSLSFRFCKAEGQDNKYKRLGIAAIKEIGENTYIVFNVSYHPQDKQLKKDIRIKLDDGNSYEFIEDKKRDFILFEKI